MRPAPRFRPTLPICPACAAEVLDPFERRFRYAFTNCTHCGPRFTIIRSIPMTAAPRQWPRFSRVRECAAEYGDPANRRFHAEPIARHASRPEAQLVRFRWTSLDLRAAFDVR